jgi:hypothetical protein
VPPVAHELPLPIPLGLSAKQRDLVVRAMTSRLEPSRFAAEHGPLSPGALAVLPAERLRYLGKSGRAYGFHLENAYIEDLQTRRGFFVTVAVYANPDSIMNDDDYAYDEISRPLMRSLGEALTRAILVPPGRSPTERWSQENQQLRTRECEYTNAECGRCA